MNERVYAYRHLQKGIEEEVSRAKRYKKAVCGLMVDIDRFEELTEQYGRVFGDKALDEVGNILTNELRSYDRIYRYDDEKFFILLPETPEEGGLTAAGRLAEKIRKHKIVNNGHCANITVSLGGSIYPDSIKNGKTSFSIFMDRLTNIVIGNLFQIKQTSKKTPELIWKAEQALERAKAIGSDNAVFWL